MDLFLLRHGAAVDIDAPGVNVDAQRYLSTQGEEAMCQAALGLKRIQNTFTLILTSPYPRARQTAEIVATTLGIVSSLRVSELLCPGATFADVAGEIAHSPLDANGPVLVVGHNPDLEEMAIDAMAPGGAALRLSKGGLAIVRFPTPTPHPGQGHLRALLTCKHLRMMAP